MPCQCPQVLPIWSFPLCSAACSATASIATHPIDVVKTRLQVLSNRGALPPAAAAVAGQHPQQARLTALQVCPQRAMQPPLRALMQVAQPRAPRNRPVCPAQRAFPQPVHTRRSRRPTLANKQPPAGDPHPTPPPHLPHPHHTHTLTHSQIPSAPHRHSPHPPSPTPNPVCRSAASCTLRRAFGGSPAAWAPGWRPCPPAAPSPGLLTSRLSAGWRGSPAQRRGNRRRQRRWQRAPLRGGRSCPAWAGGSRRAWRPRPASTASVAL